MYGHSWIVEAVGFFFSGTSFRGDRPGLRRNGFSRSKILLNVGEGRGDIAELVLAYTVGSSRSRLLKVRN